MSHIPHKVGQTILSNAAYGKLRFMQTSFKQTGQKKYIYLLTSFAWRENVKIPHRKLTALLVPQIFTYSLNTAD